MFGEFLAAPGRQEAQHPARQAQADHEGRHEGNQDALAAGQAEKRGHDRQAGADQPEIARIGAGETGLLQAAAHGGPFAPGGAVLFHVLEQGGNVLALLGGVVDGTAARLGGSGHGLHALSGRLFAADEGIGQTAQRQREQDGGHHHHWLTLSSASASSFSRL
jgi:hypothetical protein